MIDELSFFGGVAGQDGLIDGIFDRLPGQVPVGAYAIDDLVIK